MKWHLGLDLGTNSIGWAAFTETGGQGPRIERYQFLDAGVRTIPDGREPAKGGRIGDSLAVQRRLARGMRRNRDRHIHRMRHVVHLLVRYGLMPEDQTEREALRQLNPYELRNRALEQPLSQHELGRALFHLALRRGFKSNRKDSSSEEEGGKRSTQISALKEIMGDLTLGQFLYQRLEAEEPIRFRGDTPYFADRAMYAEEYDKIREKQAPHHSLSDQDWDYLRDSGVLFQRPLRPVERGKCTLFPQELRTHRDTPIAQWFRLYQELNNLRWIDSGLNAHRLTPVQRDAILEKLLTQKSTVTFQSILKLKGADKKRLFPADAQFNLEDERRKGLDPHRIAIWMQKNPVLKEIWNQRDRYALDDIFEALHDATEDEVLIAHLVQDFALTRAQAEGFARLPITSITQTLSRKVMEALVPILQDQGLTYDAAVRELSDEEGTPLHHSNLFHPEQRDRLPYYGEILSTSCLGADSAADAIQYPEKHYGRFPNPTVHIALNQLRKLVNCLIDRFGGPPAAITVELARELKISGKQRNELNKEIAKNTRRNNTLRDEWKKLSNGMEATAQDLKKLKLWEELGTDELARRCVFTGRTIAAHHLINGEVEIEHILPFSRTLDDGMANLTLAFRDANRIKGNKTPYEAFGRVAHPDYPWERILDRASRLPKNKSWRFTESAMEKFGDDDGFIARQMTDNAHIAKSARKYLTCICEDISPAPGRLTAMLRGKWHLNLGDHNRKDRDDHRHHAIDAFVVALSDRGLLQAVSRASGRSADGRFRIDLPDLPDHLRSDLRAALDRMVISYKPDHGVQGRLFNETAYGVLKEEEEGYNLVVRKPIASLSAKEIEAIRDPVWRRKVNAFLTRYGWYELDKKQQKKDLPVLLGQFSQDYGIRRIRILVKNQSVQKIASAPHKAYAPDSFICCDIWQIPPDCGDRPSKKTTYEGTFWAGTECRDDAVPQAITKRPHPAAKHLMRVFKNDMILVGRGADQKVMCVSGFSTTNNKLDLKDQYAAKAEQKYYSINPLGEDGIQRIAVMPDGRIKTRGGNL